MINLKDNCSLDRRQEGHEDSFDNQFNQIKNDSIVHLIFFQYNFEPSQQKNLIKQIKDAKILILEINQRSNEAEQTVINHFKSLLEDIKLLQYLQEFYIYLNYENDYPQKFQEIAKQVNQQSQNFSFQLVNINDQMNKGNKTYFEQNQNNERQLIINLSLQNDQSKQQYNNLNSLQQFEQLYMDGESICRLSQSIENQLEPYNNLISLSISISKDQLQLTNIDLNKIITKIQSNNHLIQLSLDFQFEISSNTVELIGKTLNSLNQIEKLEINFFLGNNINSSSIIALQSGIRSLSNLQQFSTNIPPSMLGKSLGSHSKMCNMTVINTQLEKKYPQLNKNPPMQKKEQNIVEFCISMQNQINLTNLALHLDETLIVTQESFVFLQQSIKSLSLLQYLSIKMKYSYEKADSNMFFGKCLSYCFELTELIIDIQSMQDINPKSFQLFGESILSVKNLKKIAINIKNMSSSISIVLLNYLNLYVNYYFSDNYDISFLLEKQKYQDQYNLNLDYIKNSINSKSIFKLMISSDINSEYQQNIVECIKLLQNLQYLTLAMHSNSFNEDFFIEYLTYTLVYLPNLKSLFLEFTACKFSEKLFNSIRNGFAITQKLTQLHIILKSGTIYEDSIKQLSNGIKELNNLRNLSIVLNPQVRIKKESLQHLFKRVQKLSQLNNLSIQLYPPQQHQKEILSYIANTINNLPSLNSLELNYTDMKEESEKSLITQIKSLIKITFFKYNFGKAINNNKSIQNSILRKVRNAVIIKQMLNQVQQSSLFQNQIQRC